jgi:Mg2+-importing ATPase
MNFSIPFASTHRVRAVDAVGAETNELLLVTRLEPAQACEHLGSTDGGLSAAEAEKRLAQYGLNLVTRERKPSIAQELWNRTKNPLNALLLTLAIVSYALGDLRAAIVIATMVILAITTAFIQEHRSNEAAARLRAMVNRPRPCGAVLARAMGTDLLKSPWKRWCLGTSCGCRPAT